MNVVDKALKFAIIAHKNQVRKAEKEKPYIIHPIDVSNILKKYKCSDEIIAAGILHDILEDTSYTINDLELLFGKEISKLVNISTEQNKNKSWESRKLETINKIKKLSLNEKILLCADKISNLEDINILFNINGFKDFSSFKRDEQKQYWYYLNMYNSFINNDSHAIFNELKNLIDNVFVKDFVPNKEYYLKQDILKMSIFFNDKIIFSDKIYIYHKEILIQTFESLSNAKNYYIDRYKNL